MKLRIPAAAIKAAVILDEGEYEFKFVGIKRELSKSSDAPAYNVYADFTGSGALNKDVPFRLIATEEWWDQIISFVVALGQQMPDEGDADLNMDEVNLHTGEVFTISVKPGVNRKSGKPQNDFVKIVKGGLAPSQQI